MVLRRRLRTWIRNCGALLILIIDIDFALNDQFWHRFLKFSRILAKKSNLAKWKYKISDRVKLLAHCALPARLPPRCIAEVHDSSAMCRNVISSRSYMTHKNRAMQYIANKRVAKCVNYEWVTKWMTLLHLMSGPPCQSLKQLAAPACLLSDNIYKETLGKKWTVAR